MITNSLKQMPRIAGFFDANCEMWGVRVITALIQMPDKNVHCIALSHQVEPAENRYLGPHGAEKLIQNLEKLPMTDVKTLREVDRELNRLISIKAELKSAGQDFSEQDREIEQLIKYRKECTRPNGTIKDFFCVENREYQRHRSAIKRLLDKAKKECPEAYYYVKSHLQMGIYFYWSSEKLK